MSKRETPATPTISLCMIVRDLGNERLYDCLKSIEGYVDEIEITVASDAEPSPMAIRAIETGYPNVHVSFFEWCDDFAAARNFSFSKATGKWILWLDDDDVVRGAENLAKLVAEGERQGWGAYHLLYEYRHNDRGQVTVVHNRERLLRRSVGWDWKDRVHEYCQGQTEHMVGWSDDVVVVHTTDKANIERNLRLLKLMEEEQSPFLSPRLLGAFGDIYQSSGEFEKSIAYNERLLAIETNPDVRWTVATELARSNQGLKRWDEVYRWCFAATMIHANYALPYLLMAHAAWFGEKDSGKALLYLQDADVRDEAPLTVFRQPEDYTTRRWDVEHRCYADQGKWEEALTIARQSERHNGMLEKDRAPGWAQLDYHSWYYLERVNCERSVKGAEALVDHLFRRGDTLRALRFLENDLPLTIRSDQRIIALHARVRELTAHVTTDGDQYERFYVENHYDKDHAENMLNGTVYEPYRMNTILRRLKEKGAKRVLDVGCGAGAADFFLAQNGIQVVGVDINQHAITEARRLASKEFGTLKKNGSKALYKPEFRRGTIEDIGPEDLGKFDAVLMMELLEHLPPAKVPFYLSCAEDFLLPGGSVMFTCPGMAIGDIPGVWSEFPRDHVQEFSRQDLERLILESPSRRLKRPLNLHKLFDPEVSVPGFASWFGEYEWQNADAPVAPEWEQSVAIYVGPGLEDWDAETPDEHGLGGSETWAAKTAKELRSRGHPVVVYAMADEVRDGVIYRHFSNFRPDRPFAGEKAWLCIVSRYLQMLDERPNADNVLFVAHDVDYGDELTPARVENMDAYCVMSHWQVGHTLDKYEFMGSSAKIRVIANGIEPSFFEASERQLCDDCAKKAKDYRRVVNDGNKVTLVTDSGEEIEEPCPHYGRKRHSFIWSSSPDRGLDVLLEWWPQIRLLWEDAELHVYYGWDNVDGMMATRPWLSEFKDKVVHLARQPGVTWHGRIGQRELATKMQETQFWLYPSRNAFGEPWHETFCITALEAQAGGCIPIIPRSGALPERFYFGRMVEGEQLDLAEVIDALDALDKRWPEIPLTVEPEEIASRNTWQVATDKLLAAVPSPVQELVVV